MRLLTPDQALQLDHETFGDSPARSEAFARQAAHAVFEKIHELGRSRSRALVLIGPGHNGMDARYVAEELRAEGAAVTEWELRGSPESSDPDLHEFDLVVDGLFGVGLNRPLEAKPAGLIARINSTRAGRARSGEPLTVVAIDVPSGLNALTGNPMGTALHADHTVTMQAAKPGFFQNQGPTCTGRLTVAPLPYPLPLFRSIANTHFAVGLGAAACLIPRRKRDAHKGDFGELHLVAGSERYPGAGILAARAALRTGVGYLRFVHFDRLPEGWIRIPETLPENWKTIPSNLSAESAWVLGPGVTDQGRLLRLMRGLLERGCEKVILDAGAIELIPKLDRKLPAAWLITPHPKELARLLGNSVAEVQADRFAAAQRAHEKYGATVLLKGYKSIVHARGTSFVILRGNSALAKAGSGDVLAGILGGYRAQGLDAVRSAVLGALVHGIAADVWLRAGDAASMNPSDLIELLPRVQKEIKTSPRARS